MEIEKWKGRVNALMRDSQYGDEWAKMQAEMVEIREEIGKLSSANTDLERSLSEKSAALDQTSHDLNLLREQTTLEKQNHQRDMETLRNDKKTREDTFRTLVGGLRDLVTEVQRELELKDFDWSMKAGGATAQERNKVIKEDVEIKKRTIIEKLKSLKETIKVKDGF